MTTTDSNVNATWVPQECTLPTAQLPLRVAEFDTVFTTVLRAVHRVDPGRLRLVLDGAAEVEATVRELARRETQCCSFFTFDLARSNDDQQLYVDVAVPENHVDVLDALADRATARL